MTQHTKHHKKKWLKSIGKALVFLLTVAVVAYFFPRQSKYKYQFELGKPWQYDLLTATYDFPIYKTQTELKQQRDSILQDKKLFYDHLAEVERNQLPILEHNIAVHFGRISNEAGQLPDSINASLYLSYVRKQLHLIYERGVLSNKDYATLIDEGIDHIAVMDSGVFKNRLTENLLSVSKAIYQLEVNLPSQLSIHQLSMCDYSACLTANLAYNATLTNQIKTDELNNLSLSSGMVQAGERIIDRGEIVNEQAYKKLDSLRRAELDETAGNELSTRRQIGYILLIISLLSLFFLYARLFRKRLYESRRFVILTMLSIMLYVCITSLVVRLVRDTVAVYMIPYALLPILISTFFDTRTALFAHLITIMLCSFLAPIPFEFVVLQVSAGMITISSMKDLSQRAQLVQSALLIFACYSIFYTGYALTLDGNITSFNWHIYLSFAINGLLLLFAYPLIYIIEKTFGFISNVTLIELTNTNNPLLRKLSENAPGTFQHSMQVSNLAAEIAVKVGANALLVRTGALYHDIGKLSNPAFFTENQSGNYNPHQQLKAEESARIIIEHISKGVKLAEEHHIPTIITDFIRTHHGNNVTRYFYNTWINEHPGQQPDASKFSYPGPAPQTKEQGILMICDTVEAASRSLKEYTDESIDKLVERLVKDIIDEHLLDNVPMTLQQVSLTKNILKDKLKNIYHTRIAYPEISKSSVS